MAPRANWKGYLRLSLVSCPIALYPASSSSEKVSFNRINGKTGNRLKQQNVDSETGDVVPREDTARGYEVAKGQYLTIEDEEIDAVHSAGAKLLRSGPRILFSRPNRPGWAPSGDPPSDGPKAAVAW